LLQSKSGVVVVDCRFRRARKSNPAYSNRASFLHPEIRFTTTN